MLQSPVRSLREKRLSQAFDDDYNCDPMADFDDEFDDDGGGVDAKGRAKSRRELPTGAVSTLKAWLLSPEHFTHPYPTPQDQAMLMQKTGIDKKQLKNWFTNARRRIWKPMLKKQIEQGKLTAPGSSLMMQGQGGGVGMDNPHSIQAMRVHYQQAVQSTDQAQSGQTDVYGNQMYDPNNSQYYISQPLDRMQSQGSIPSNSSIGTLPQLSSNVNLSKTDSHAVLMELFARDQDLVRQATESARMKQETRQGQQQQQQQAAGLQTLTQSQHSAKPTGGLLSVPSLNSWPHFSSINSLNNLGTIPGVRSITSLTGSDVAGKGSLNKMGNLAQVKSMESMGKNDSYAFLEVFFGDRSSNVNLSGMGGRDQKGSKNSCEEDNEIGLSLEDESPQHMTSKKDFSVPAPMSSAPQPTSMASGAQETVMDSGTLKRAYDDALAARGLMSVSRSCENLSDLVLPAKMQRTLSQEFINEDQIKAQQVQSQQQSYGHYTSTSFHSDQSLSQYPGQQASEPSHDFDDPSNETDGHVTVSTSTICAICQQPNVDTQLRPCGHMFHERCLKPSLQTPMGQPKCPVDDVPMHSAVLAVPTDEHLQKPDSATSWTSFSRQHSLSTEHLN